MIRQRKDRDGLQIQVYAGRDALTGRKRYVSRQVQGSGRAAMKQAKQVEAELLAEVGSGKHRASGAMTLGQLLKEWISWRESNGKSISPATLHNYRLTIDTKIKPGLGRLPVAKVDARMVDRFYAALRKGGNARTGGGALSASRVRDVHAILSGALGLAARWNYIPFNPAVLARPPAAKSAARRLPNADEAKAIMAAARERDPEFELFVRIGASTGLRRGEVVALRWRDFDLDGGEITVSRATCCSCAPWREAAPARAQERQQPAAAGPGRPDSRAGAGAPRPAGRGRAGGGRADGGGLLPVHAGPRRVPPDPPGRVDAPVQPPGGAARASVHPCTAAALHGHAARRGGGGRHGAGAHGARELGGVEHLHAPGKRRRPGGGRAHGAGAGSGIAGPEGASSPTVERRVGSGSWTLRNCRRGRRSAQPSCCATRATSSRTWASSRPEPNSSSTSARSRSVGDTRMDTGVGLLSSG